MQKKRSLWFALSALLVLSLIVSACGGATPAAEAPAAAAPAAAVEATAAPAAAVETPAAAPAAGPVTLSLWTHSAGNELELGAIQTMVDTYNASQSGAKVVIEAFPQASYNDSVAAASVAGSLPCVLDLDGPTVPNFAWSGYLAPMAITDAELEEMGIIPADVGRFNGQVYALGPFDVALLIYARQSVLEKYEIRIPTLDSPWTLDEFSTILATLQDSGEFENAIDVNAAWTGEWYSYAYSPMLQSFGGDLIDRTDYMTAEGALNGPEAVAWGEWWKGLFANGYANPTPADDQGFFQGRVALWYTGSWSANDVVTNVGDDALFLPAVDFGNGPKIGAASWQWGVSDACVDKDAAFDFVKYLLAPEQVALMSETTGLVPTTFAGAALTEKFAEGGPFRVFYDMANAYAVVRPQTPAYLAISSQFEQAAIKIRDGGNVQDALDDAVDAINRDIADNGGYGMGN